MTHLPDPHQNLHLTSGSWCGDQTISISFPSHWSVTCHAGTTNPVLNESRITEKISSSIGNSSGLITRLKPNSKVAIVVDDHTRPTPVKSILEPLLQVLLHHGVKRENIKVLIALGTHILENKAFLRNKLGNLMDGEPEILFPDCRDCSQLVHVGDSSGNIPIYVNKFFASADVKISVSGVYPHDEAGFSGGAKILIGVLGLETISKFHRKHSLLRRGSAVDTEFRKELEHFADLVNLDFSINCIINHKKEITDIYCGDFRESFREAVVVAKKSFETSVDADADVVICNAYPLDTSLSVLGKSKWPFNYCSNSAYRIMVTALCNCSGERVHLTGGKVDAFAKKIKKLSGASGLKRLVKSTSIRSKSVLDRNFKYHNEYLVYIGYKEEACEKLPKMINNCIVVYDWQSIIADIVAKFGREHPVKVSVYPYAPLLFPSSQYQPFV
jgi:nickel-dependent lactate racemase